MNTIKGYRTIAFQVIMLFLMLISMGNDEAKSITPDAINQFLDQAEGVIAFVWGVGNIALRYFTTTPIFKRD